MELLALQPSKLPLTETLEYKASASIADGDIVIQYMCGRDRLIIDLSLSARLGKGLLGRAEVKAVSEWQLENTWVPKSFAMESSLWGVNKRSGFDLQEGELDPLSVAYALRCFPISTVGDRRLFKTRDESRAKTIELYAAEKRRDSTALNGEEELLKLEMREQNDSSRRPDHWQFWVESSANVLTQIDVGHEKLGSLTFKLAGRR